LAAGRGLEDDELEDSGASKRFMVFVCFGKCINKCKDWTYPKSSNCKIPVQASVVELDSGDLKHLRIDAVDICFLYTY
jgi:hypothetical protein